jgi:hypothetical protein
VIAAERDAGVHDPEVFARDLQVEDVAHEVDERQVGRGDLGGQLGIGGRSLRVEYEASVAAPPNSGTNGYVSRPRPFA